MSIPCSHPRTGIVTSHPNGRTDEPHAATNVCELPECLEEAMAWVGRMTHGEPGFYVADVEAGA